ncbi:hypothetical protein DUI87_22873 [Hirundo rustica rustica]|uniref:Rna-directed dna polymerase from mobile element jockey-like n=1 Tax=Hirundo rustica rustica TaxID=333673 RepID=A0A3M0JGZ9_HIRRU|nr:hypothetical protein DUI87_22873 [Hirundo rustica rustica]
MAPYPSGKQQSVLGLGLFNTFVSDKGSGTEHILSKFTGDTKLCGAIDTLERRDALRGNLDRFEGLNMKSNKAKCTVLHLGQSNSRYKHGLGQEWIESSPEKDSGVLLWFEQNEKNVVFEESSLPYTDK